LVLHTKGNINLQGLRQQSAEENVGESDRTFTIGTLHKTSLLLGDQVKVENDRKGI
jgi:hypothetical protein